MSGGTMRGLPDMVAELRALAEHIARMDSGSGDAALLRDAANYVEGATDSLREHMMELRNAQEEIASLLTAEANHAAARASAEAEARWVGQQTADAADYEHAMGFYDGRDRAVAILMRKAHASEDDDLTPIEEAIREQMIYAAREIRELQPKDQAL